MYKHEHLELAMDMTKMIPDGAGTLEILGAIEWLISWQLDQKTERKDLQVADAILEDMKKEVLKFLENKCDWS